MLIGVGYSIGKDPEGAASTARSLLEFGQTHPTAMSAAIVAIVAILITPYIIPLVLTGAICLFLWDPKAVTSLLPSPPPVPSWMIPAPFKVRSRLLALMLSRFLSQGCLPPEVLMGISLDRQIRMPGVTLK